MHYRSAIRAVAVALAVALLMAVGGARGHDDTKYPNVGTENYFPSADGFLIPAKEDQPPPDLRYFNPSRK